MDKKRLTRRQFMKGVSATCACGNLLFNPFSLGTARGKTEKRERGKILPDMEYRILGKTGLKVSALSFGVMRLTEPAVLFEALKMGVNYFDTAHTYQNGNNEKMLGRVLKDYGRAEVFVATKIPPYRRAMGIKVIRDTEEMEQMMDKSLQRLRTDYVDILFLHNIEDPKWPVNEEMITFLEKQKKAGKARFVGISFHVEGSRYVEIVNQALKANCYDVFLATHNFKSPPEHIEALRLAQSKKVGIVSMKTQAGGYGKGVRAGFNPHQAALRWVLDHDFVACAIPGMVNLEQLQQNMAALGKKPGWGDRKVLDTYYAAVRDRYCVRCGKCSSSCSSNVDVPTIHRSLMYWEGYEDLELARATYRELSTEENATACMSCSRPTCRCVNGIKIAERMRHAHTMLA
ncbi:MAG: aldo/keto reductase [Thermodesulfobacteriota bacterium]|nr:aldo/keto reductase [Thermodesulfobacteriota bacterium]